MTRGINFKNNNAILIGEAEKGPAFVPTVVSNISDFTNTFGSFYGKYEVAYAAKNYLKNNNALTVIRVLGNDDGLNVTAGYTASLSAITDGSNALCLLHHYGSTSCVKVEGIDNNSFTINIYYPGSATPLFYATASLITSSANYIDKVLNADPTLLRTYGHYIYANYKFAIQSASASWNCEEVTDRYSDYTYNCSYASTAWIKSQPLGGNEINLFKLNTKSYGDISNKEIKVTIANIRLPDDTINEYSTFDIFVRRFNDLDKSPQVLETFLNCTLDEASENYILRKIGDNREEFNSSTRKLDIKGKYVSNSNYVWAEVNEDVSIPKEALPWGFRGYTHLTFSSGSAAPNILYTKNLQDRSNNEDGNTCWGVSFISGGIEDRMKIVPKNSTTAQASDADFSLSYLSSSLNSSDKQVWTYNENIDDYLLHRPLYSFESLYKFTMPFYGGFDGWDNKIKNPLYIENQAGDEDISVLSIKRAIDTIKDIDNLEADIIAIPSVHNLVVTDYMRNIADNKQNVLYIMDITGSTVFEAAGIKNREINSSYTVCYYPSLRVIDNETNKAVKVSPSAAMFAALSFNDRISNCFYPPAGAERTSLNQFNVVNVCDNLTSQDKDILLKNNINIITSSTVHGIACWSQKTMQKKQSSLTNINVRRLLIYTKKVISSFASKIIFEQSTPQVWQNFMNSVNPILNKVRQENGLYTYKVVVDSTTNTKEMIDNNIVAGKIFLQPTKFIEQSDIKFVVDNSNIFFEE
jgi:hypothetical protein